LKEKIREEMERYFGDDAKRIKHANRVLGYAEQIMETESGDRDIVCAAAILHDIGIREAEKKHGSSAGKYQEIEGPRIAEEILKRLNFPEVKIKPVLDIIAHHHSPRDGESQNYKVLYDSDWLVNIKDEVGLEDKEKIARVIENVFLTDTGKQLAKKLYT
jgi:HD superfamily phosphodiesterase